MLNNRQEAFALNLVKGMTQYEAYTNAGYSNGNKKTTAENACRLAKNDKIVARIQELRQPICDEAVTSLRERRQIYSKWSRLKINDKRLSEESKAKYKFEALNRENQMEHVYSDAPVQDRRSYTIVLNTPEAIEIAKQITSGELFKDKENND